MSEIVNERQALMVLNGLPGIGPVSTTRLLERFGGEPLAIFKAGQKSLLEVEGIGQKSSRAILDWPKHFDLSREESLLQKYNARFITINDEEYPPLLREIYDPPAGFYCKGDSLLKTTYAAIVGTRRPTLYGRSVAARLAGDLIRLGFCVVSGFARGIDSEAHQGALDAGGKTVAIMGCGLDIIYPPENLELYRRIVQPGAGAGAVISEFRFGRRADRLTFPMRNRLISGMCQAIIVGESDLKGGSMITARFAGEHGRFLFAVPGRIDQAASRGCNRLIRDGATLLSSVDDLVEELRYTGQMSFDLDSSASGVKEPPPEKYLPDNLSETEKTVAQCFADGSILYPDIVNEIIGLPLNEVTAALMKLELNKILIKRADGSYEPTA